MYNNGCNRGCDSGRSRGCGCNDEVSRMEAALADAVRSLENTECAADQIRCAF